MLVILYFHIVFDIYFNIIILEINSKMNHSKMVVVGGGGLFLPDSNTNSVSGWQWPISKDYLHKINTPLILFSIGYNYFYGQEPGNIFVDNLNEVVNCADFIGIRNSGSIQALNKLLTIENRTKLMYQPCTTTLIRKFIQLTPKKQTGRIALNMAFDRPKLRFGDNELIICEQVAKAMKILDSEGYDLVYVAHCEEDLEFLHYLNEHAVNYILKDISQYKPQEVFNFYNKIDLIFGMRGHAQMIPFGLNCEIITLSTHEKMKWFLQDINSMDWYINLNEDIKSISDRMIDIFHKIYNNPEVTERLLSEQNRLWNITTENMRLICNIINCD